MGYGTLFKHFGTDVGKHGKTLEDILEKIKSYRDHCPFYTASASELFTQRAQILKRLRSKILLFLVEPDSIQNKVARKILEDKGYHVLSVDNETDALSYFEKNQHEISITIIEFSMPHGLNIIKHIETAQPEMNILVCSGNPTCSAEEGCDYCEDNLNRKRLLKPYYIDHLLTIISDFESYDCELKGKCEPMNDLDKSRFKPPA